MRRISTGIRTGAFLQQSLYPQTSVHYVPEGCIVPVCGLRLREPVLPSARQTSSVDTHCLQVTFTCIFVNSQSYLCFIINLKFMEKTFNLIQRVFFTRNHFQVCSSPLYFRITVTSLQNTYFYRLLRIHIITRYIQDSIKAVHNTHITKYITIIYYVIYLQNCE